MPRYASGGFSSGVVKVLVSFYRSREDSAFERHRSKVTFDLSKQSSVAAVKKHLREFLGLNELALYFSDFIFASLRKSSEVFRNDRELSESGRKLVDILNKITLPFLEAFLFPSA